MLPAALVLAALAVALGTSTPAQAHAERCDRRDTSVALTPDAAAPRYRIAGWLCRPRQATGTVQLLVSGFSYDHRYWDVPGEGGRQSYLRAALDAGTAVYAIDRIGVGQSDRPPAEQVTVPSEAYVTHQLVHALRSGRLARFNWVIAVGHSLGSGILMVEAADHHDVDALVLTGSLHQANPAQQAMNAASRYPASEDPAFAHTHMPDGYLTTKPGTRSTNYFYTPGATAAMIALDERTKATGTTGEQATINVARDPAYSQRLHLPVLLIVGEHDSLMCSSTAGLPCTSGADLCSREKSFYRAGTPLFAATTPGSGHSINLHRAAPAEFQLVNRWIRTGTPAIHRPAPTPCVT